MQKLKYFMSLSEDNQSGVIEAFNSSSRYLDDLLNIDNNFFDSMVNRIYPSELQLNKAKVSDAEAAFFDLHLSISDGFVKTKIYDKRDDFDFDIVNFPFLDGDVPRSASYSVYISQLIRFARVSSHVDDFNTRNKVLTAKLLKQGYRYHKRRKAIPGWSGGAKVLGKLPVPGRPTHLDYSRARAFCARSRCGWGLFGHFFSHLSLLFSFSLSLGDGPI